MNIITFLDPVLLQQLVKDLIKACEDEIAKESRPADAFPIDKLIAIFLVRVGDEAGWKDRVPNELWVRLGRLTQHCLLFLATELEMKREVWALNHHDLNNFRAGVPILKVVAPFKLRRLARGTRTNHDIEIAIREALELEVFRRDIEIAALQSAKANKSNGANISAIRGAGLIELADRAWVEGVPTKGLAADKRRPHADRRVELFSNLRSEGEKSAHKWMPGGRPEDVVQNIIKYVATFPIAKLSAVDFEAAVAEPAGYVATLMKACAHVTNISREKHAVARKFKKPEAPAEPIDLAQYADEPMNPRQHELLSDGEFSAKELAYIASQADVDPNVLDPSHVLATPEFVLARKLGRLCRGAQIELNLVEVGDLHDWIFCKKRMEIYSDIYDLLTQMAFSIRPAEWWAETLEGAIARRCAVSISHPPPR